MCSEVFPTLQLHIWTQPAPKSSLLPLLIPAEWPFPWESQPPPREHQPKLFCLHGFSFPVQVDGAGEDPVPGAWAESLGLPCERISRKGAKQKPNPGLVLAGIEVNFFIPLPTSLFGFIRLWQKRSCKNFEFFKMLKQYLREFTHLI